MAPKIRRAMLADFRALSQLFEEVDRLHREALPDLFQQARGAPREMAYIRSLIVGRDSDIIVAVNDGQIVGCVVLMIRDAPKIPILVPLQYVMIDTLVVVPDARGGGLGRQLMASAEQWAHERGIDRVELNVFEFNEGARAFYEKLGYETLSRRMVKRLDIQQESPGDETGKGARDTAND
ncbi:MAG: GNAT family N-acetyltransferase [Anaerolineae bacterium]